MFTIAALHLVTGTGLVQRHDDTVVAVDDEAGDGGFATAVLNDCRELSGPDLVRRLAGRVLQLAPSEPVRLGVVTTTGHGPLAFLHGDIELRTDEAVVSGADLVTGIEVALDGVPSLTLAPAGADARSDARTDLTSGVVAASGFHLDFSLPSPALRLAGPTDESQSELDTPTVERQVFAAPHVAPSTEIREVEPIDLDESPPPGPAPTVVLSAVPSSPVDGPRPRPCVLVLDDRTTIPIVDDLVLGREPDEHDLVARGDALAVELPDPAQSVSRIHAHVALEGSDVHVSDLGSANGTFVQQRPDAGWVEIAGADRVRLEPGAAIRLGDRSLTFEPSDVIAERAS